ncbi:MAG: PepSY domain-containing protein [Rhizobiaceae bacterium]
MFNASFRKVALAFTAATTLLTVSPSFAGGWAEPEVIVTEDGVIVDGHNTRRHPVYEDVYNYDILSERQIIRSLRHQGYGHVREISLRHDTYRVVAVRHNGAVTKLRVSALDGQILSARRIGWVRTAPARIYEHPRPRLRHAEPGVSIEFGWSSN